MPRPVAPMMTAPLVTFYQFIREPGALHLAPPRLPERATPDASGTLPSQALRYCEPVRAASAYGYYLYPPMNIGLRFDGAEIEWSMDENGTGAGANWYSLNESVYYPGFVEHWNQTAPSYLRDMVPPLLTPGNTPGLVQVWSGAIGRTQESWSLLIRGPVNDRRRSMGYEVLEGIIETDRWSGHLFANLLMLRSEVAVFLHANCPYIQAIPVQREHYGDRLLNAYEVRSEIPPDVWRGYGDIVIGNRDGSRPLGQYAVDTRRRRAAES